MEFKYFHGDKDSVESAISHDKLLTKTIIRNAKNNTYIVFNKYKEFKEWYKKQRDNGDVYYHEIILGDMKQKLKIDIDSYNIINPFEICDSLIDILNELYYPKTFSHNDFIICDSSRECNDGYKWSYHIISRTFCLKNNKEAINITKLLVNSTNIDCIDTSVNKSLQSFRLLYSCKEAGKPKCLMKEFEENTTLSHTIISYITKNIEVLKELVIPGCDESINNEIHDDPDLFIKNIMENISMYDSKLLYSHSFRQLEKNGMLSFNRLTGSYCTICRRVHDKDNTLLISCEQDMLYEICRRHPEIKRKIGKIINLHSDNSENLDKYEDYPNIKKHEYCKNKIEDYPLEKTLIIKAPMKMGKTKALKTYVDTYFKDKKIIFVSFRQTFSQHSKNIFNDFTLYSQIQGPINMTINNKIIIQVESLHRIDIKNLNIDLLILDECESIFSQFDSGLHKNFNTSFAVFMWMFKNAKHLICLDANVSERTLNMVQKYRESESHMYTNTFNNCNKDIYYRTSNIGLWMLKLTELLEEGKKICIVSNSITNAKACEIFIKSKFSDLNIKCYSSETDINEKTLHFNDVQKYWTELDVLIYTPTCSAGVSFEVEHFDVLFGYFTDASCDVETCRQMMGRIRNLSSKTYYICFRAFSQTSLPETICDMHNFMKAKRNAIFHDTSNLQWRYDDQGNIEFYETDYYFMWLNNIIITNKSKNNFITRFCEQITNCGSKILNLMFNDFSKIKIDICNEEYKDIKSMVVTSSATEISTAKTLSPDEASEINSSLNNLTTVSQSDMNALTKYKLLKFYNCDDIEIDTNFVLTFNTPQMKDVYKNLCDISKFEYLRECIDHLKNMERQRFNDITLCDINNDIRLKLEHNDLKYDKLNYKSLRHELAYVILEHFEYGIEFDKSDYEYCRDNIIYPKILQLSSFINTELKIKINETKPNITINAILREVYGLNIVTRDRKYVLQRNNKYKPIKIVKQSHDLESQDKCVYIPTVNKLLLLLT